MAETQEKSETLSQGAASGDKDKLGRKFYEAELYKLQVDLCKLQTWVKQTGAKIIIIFEGRDAAGKGGIIRANSRDSLLIAATAGENSTVALHQLAPAVSACELSPKHR